MDCYDVRERFSLLWEKELSPSEEAEMKGHLRVCADCQLEFSRFDRTLQMLHSVEEVEVPGGILSGIYGKMEERKQGALYGERPIKSKWFGISSSWRLPVQAVAMVAVVFLALYLTKMDPVERSVLKEVPLEKAPVAERPRTAVETQAPRVEEKKAEMPEATKEFEKKREKGSVSGKVRDEAKAAEPVMEARKPVPEPEIVADQLPREKEVETFAVGALKEKKGDETPSKREMALLKTESSREFSLKVSDLKKAVSELQELVKQAGGETLKTEEKMLIVSIPGASFPEFRKATEGVGSAPKPGPMAPVRAARAAKSAVPETKSREAQEEVPKPEMLSPSKEDRIVVRILLWEE